jgi:hypothetical protein
VHILHAESTTSLISNHLLEKNECIHSLHANEWQFINVQESSHRANLLQIDCELNNCRLKSEADLAPPGCRCAQGKVGPVIFQVKLEIFNLQLVFKM